MTEQSSFFMHNPAPALQVGFNGKVIQMNNAAEKIFGGHVTKKDVRQVIPEFGKLEIEKISASKSIYIDAPISGKYFNFTIKKAPDADCVYIYGSDITELQQIKDELCISKDIAEKADKAKREFLANTTHEIRTPMNGVIGMANILLDTELSEEQRDYAETIKYSGNALLRVINDILDFSKIENEKLDIEIIDFDLQHTLEEIADKFARKATEKDLAFSNSLEPEVPTLLRGDPGRLRQIIFNLLDNAFKFTSKGGISLRVNLDSENGNRVKLRFAVSDTGIGIPKDKLESIFSEFIQVDGSTTRKFGGAGLGLSISKQLVKLMEGEIGVESKEGKGSTFWFKVLLEKQPDGKKRDIILYPDFTSQRILVVDDNYTNRKFISVLLDSWKCPYDHAADSETALRKLREAVEKNDPFKIAIIDKFMPKMNGDSLGKKIKADEKISSTLLIMLTSYGERGDASHVKTIGFSAYLPKPVNPSKLYNSLHMVLSHTMENSMKECHDLITKHSIAESKLCKDRILLVEDNITNQKVAMTMLIRLGYRADVVANGKEALRSLETHPYDLVLMDVHMPEMNGFEATHAIRDPNSKALSHNIPIVAMTANAMKGDREKCLEAGMNDYVSKPFQSKDLAQVIERNLRNKEAAISED